MTVDEMQKAIDQLKAEGHSEDEILGAFYKMFQDDKLTLEQLDGIVNLMGYHLTDEFKAMSPEDQKTKGFEQTNEPAEGVDNKDIEEGKEAETEAEEKSEPQENAEDKPEEKNESEDESEEEKKAMKLFNLDK